MQKRASTKNNSLNKLLKEVSINKSEFCRLANIKLNSLYYLMRKEEYKKDLLKELLKVLEIKSKKMNEYISKVNKIINKA